jgi:hypothetical protein
MLLLVFVAAFVTAPAMALSRAPKRAAPSVITPPRLTGTAQQGRVLTLTVGTWRHSTTQDGTWMDCNISGKACHAVSVQSGRSLGDSYTLVASDVGHTILVLETATGPGGSRRVRSNTTAVVGAAQAPVVESPFPVTEATTAPPSSVRDQPAFVSPLTTCEAAAGPVFSASSSICGFEEQLPTAPIAPVIPAESARHIDEMQELCADFVSVLNYESITAPQHPEQLEGEQQYYFDAAAPAGPNDNCFALAGGNLGGNRWEFLFNESNVPYPPTTITAFANSIPVADFPFVLPFPNEP